MKRAICTLDPPARKPGGAARIRPPPGSRRLAAHIVLARHRGGDEGRAELSQASDGVADLGEEGVDFVVLRSRKAAMASCAVAEGIINGHAARFS